MPKKRFSAEQIVVVLVRGVPEHIRSDNGAEMTAKIVRSWFAKLGAQTLDIEPGSPWESG
jgi:putative transposase